MDIKQIHRGRKHGLKTFWFLLFLAVISSCEKKFNWNYDDFDYPHPVVESLITNELKNQTVILSYAKSAPSLPALPFSGAVVTVKIGETVYGFTESTLSPGTYISQLQFIGVSGQEITLRIEYEGIIYEATDQMEPVSPSARALFLPLENDSTMFYFVKSNAIFNTPEPAMWELIVVWDTLPGYEDEDPKLCRARFFYYNLKTLDPGSIFAPQGEKVYVPKGATVFQTKYSLSEKHVNFRRSLLLETEWRGGLMDVSPGSVYTNLSEGALGFFGACAVAKDTFQIQ